MKKCQMNVNFNVAYTLYSGSGGLIATLSQFLLSNFTKPLVIVLIDFKFVLSDGRLHVLMLLWSDEMLCALDLFNGNPPSISSSGSDEKRSHKVVCGAFNSGFFATILLPSNFPIDPPLMSPPDGVGTFLLLFFSLFFFSDGNVNQCNRSKVWKCDFFSVVESSPMSRSLSTVLVAFSISNNTEESSEERPRAKINLFPLGILSFGVQHIFLMLSSIIKITSWKFYFVYFLVDDIIPNSLKYISLFVRLKRRDVDLWIILLCCVFIKIEIQVDSFRYLFAVKQLKKELELIFLLITSKETNKVLKWMNNSKDKLCIFDNSLLIKPFTPQKPTRTIEF